MSDSRLCPTCPHHESATCVRNLVTVSGELAPISFGLHVGLNHVYGTEGTPPCVRGALGAGFWSTVPDDAAKDESS